MLMPSSPAICLLAAPSAINCSTSTSRLVSLTLGFPPLPFGAAAEILRMRWEITGLKNRFPPATSRIACVTRLAGESFKM